MYKGFYAAYAKIKAGRPNETPRLDRILESWRESRHGTDAVWIEHVISFDYYWK